MTEGSIITPTGTYQPITAASEVTTSVTTAVGAPSTGTGSLVWLNNTSAYTITLKNGAASVLPGAADLGLGQNDAVGLLYDGTNWVARFSVNN